MECKAAFGLSCCWLLLAAADCEFNKSETEETANKVRPSCLSHLAAPCFQLSKLFHHCMLAWQTPLWLRMISYLYPSQKWRN
jgi:hypothetical protein